MARKKVKLAWIANDCARRASLKKRRLGLLKKVSELITLCGVKAGVIVYSPEENEPAVWPSHAVVQRLLVSFHKMPELERLKKMMNQETYLRERVNKGQEQQRKCQRRNKEVEMGQLMDQINQGKGIDELNLNELQGLIWLVEEKMKEIRKRIGFFQQVPFAPTSNHHGDLSLPPQGPADDLTPTDSLMWDQWFIDMMNNNELKSAADNLGLPRHSFGGSSSVAADVGLPQYGNFRGPTSDMGLPPLSFRSYGGGDATDMGLLPHGSVGGSSFGPFGSDMGLGLHPFGHVGSSSAGSEFGGMPFRLFGGGSSGGAGSDMGLPFDGKTWPNNFFP